MSQEFNSKLIEKIMHYRCNIQGLPESTPEIRLLNKELQTEEDILNAVEMIFNSSHELARLVEESPNSMFVVDEKGECLRVNKAFEGMVKIHREDIIGRNVADLDAEGLFRPSVCLLTLKERRPVSVLQDIGDVSGMAVTGVPIFDNKGSLFRVITNAVLAEDVESLTTYLKDSKAQKHRSNQGQVEIIAESTSMKTVVQLSDMVKDTESSILITGETGVGKGILARYIHETGYRREKRLVHINCGAIPNSLLESELFGYESGAFTGADKKGKPGLIELAHEGTLFLDEIGELPLLLQVKLLHFIQSKRLTRVGGTRDILVDTRIIAATNRDLQEQVTLRQFRADLYYRLNVIPINIAPLRERREDIKPMAELFFQYYMRKYNKHLKISEEFLKEISKYSWLGNVRELENFIERTVVTSQSHFLKTENVVELTHPHEEKETTAQNAGAALKDAVVDAEKDLIIAAYKKYKTSYKVAEALGISQSTAFRKIKKYIKE